MVIIVGRGHCGTRIPSKLLYTNGYFTGKLNVSFDLLPPHKLYDAVKIFSKLVKQKDDYEWDFNVGDPTPKFEEKVNGYLQEILEQKTEKKYFKLPETTLCYPWILKMFPNAHYIHWIRDPRDFSPHMSDNFERWNVPCKAEDDKRKMAAISCKYQWDIVENTPKPKNFIRIKYENFCTNQKRELKKLNEFLNEDLEPTNVRTDKVQKWKIDQEYVYYPFLKEMLEKNNYATAQVKFL